MNTFELSRNFWNWAFDNPEKIDTNHAAIFFFAIEHCNRLGGKEKFGLPSMMTMEAVGIKKHQTYSKYFNQLIEFGFIKLIQKSTNQYSANIISLVYAVPKKDKALDKALVKHMAKQTESTGQSTGQSKDNIDKQVNKETIKQINNIEERKLKFASTLTSFKLIYDKDELKKFYDYWTEPNKSNTKFRQELEKTWSLKRRLDTWFSNKKTFNKEKSSDKKEYPQTLEEKYAHLMPKNNE